jgi:uncharacterized metal-binding protein
MSAETKACCGPIRVKLVYACSGASDVGALTDLAARRINRSKVAYMSCTAGIGAGVPEILEPAKTAVQILVLDGCERDCARLCLEQAGIHRFQHLQMKRDIGWEKGKTPPDDDKVACVVERGIQLLNSLPIEETTP